MKKRAFILLAVLWAWTCGHAGWGFAGEVEAEGAVRRNIALGKPYTLYPKPNYQHCTDQGDTVQLTDGELTKGYFWTQKGTVGWRKVAHAEVTIDLGRVYPIGGLSLRSAAGRAGVAWLQIALIMVSDDGKAYFRAGELVGLSSAHGLPPAEGYGVHAYATDDLKTHGRFVKILLISEGPYIFCDEIEVYQGSDALMRVSRGEAVTDVKVLLRKERFTACLRRRFVQDMRALEDKIAGADIPRRKRKALNERIQTLAPLVGEACNESPGEFRAVLPMNDWHKRLIAIQGELWRLRNLPRFAAWPVNQWDMIGFWVDPPAEHPGERITVEMMRNEVRSAAFNMASSSASALRVRVRFTGTDRNALARSVQFHRVEWTDTKQGTVVAAALVPFGNKTEVTLIPGMSTQVWLRVDSSALSSGTFTGNVTLTPDAGRRISLPITVTVHPVVFPKRPSLHVGGWDYMDTDNTYGVTPANRKMLIEHLATRFVDVPWARRGVMPSGTFDDQGNVQEPPATEPFDAWVKLWPDARIYAIFLSVGDTFAGSRTGTELFRHKVAAWMKWWAAHFKSQGIDPSRVAFLLVDEPRNRDLDLRIMAWARVIKSVAPEVIIWEDPCHIVWKQGEYDPETRQRMFDTCDVLCAQRPRYLAVPEYKKFFENLKPGQELWFYSCSGPTRLLDPYAYYRLQAWECWQAGGKGTHFWAFASTGGSQSSWNEYLQAGTGYTPLFLDETSVTPGKHMEAIVESVEDYEYLRMLKEALNEARALGRRGRAVRQAKRLLEEAAGRVLNAPGALELQWKDPKDRSVADTVRVEVLRALVKLSKR